MKLIINNLLKQEIIIHYHINNYTTRVILLTLEFISQDQISAIDIY